MPGHHATKRRCLKPNLHILFLFYMPLSPSFCPCFFSLFPLSSFNPPITFSRYHFLSSYFFILAPLAIRRLIQLLLSLHLHKGTKNIRRFLPAQALSSGTLVKVEMWTYCSNIVIEKKAIAANWNFVSIFSLHYATGSCVMSSDVASSSGAYSFCDGW